MRDFGKHLLMVFWMRFFLVPFMLLLFYLDKGLDISKLMIFSSTYTLYLCNFLGSGRSCCYYFLGLYGVSDAMYIFLLVYRSPRVVNNSHRLIYRVVSSWITDDIK
jgi:hypothetical protein